jgi:hypothetical protein
MAAEETATAAKASRVFGTSMAMHHSNSGLLITFDLRGLSQKKW